MVGKQCMHATQYKLAPLLHRLCKQRRRPTASTPKILEMNSMSSRSISLTTMILALQGYGQTIQALLMSFMAGPAFAQKSNERSVTASRKMDFCTSRTLQPVLATCFTILASVTTLHITACTASEHFGALRLD